MELGKINNEIKDELFNEKFCRENAEKNEKNNSELARKYQNESYEIRKQVEAWKTKYESSQKEVELWQKKYGILEDQLEKEISNLKVKLSKKVKRKKK
jgi:hypothetical protein